MNMIGNCVWALTTVVLLVLVFGLWRRVWQIDESLDTKSEKEKAQDKRISDLEWEIEHLKKKNTDQETCQQKTSIDLMRLRQVIDQTRKMAQEANAQLAGKKDD